MNLTEQLYWMDFLVYLAHTGIQMAENINILALVLLYIL
jgi:hypothetical protein